MVPDPTPPILNITKLNLPISTSKIWIQPRPLDLLYCNEVFLSGQLQISVVGLS